MIDLKNHFSTSHSKILLNDWVVIRDMIIQKTTWVKDFAKTPLDTLSLNTLLNDQQINDALNGPFQTFFQSHLKAYAHIARYITLTIVQKEDFFKESEQVDKTLGLPLEKINRIDASTLRESRVKLDAITQEHMAQWDALVTEWNNQFIHTLAENKLSLTDLEKKDFEINQPLSELHNRLVDLKIEIPKLSKSSFDFQQYFTIKIVLAIKSALGRMQMPATSKEVNEKIKFFHSTLKAASKAEKKLMQEQQKALSTITV